MVCSVVVPSCLVPLLPKGHWGLYYISNGHDSTVAAGALWWTPSGRVRCSSTISRGYFEIRDPNHTVLYIDHGAILKCWGDNHI